MISKFATLFLLAGMLGTISVVAAQQGNYSYPAPASPFGSDLTNFGPTTGVLHVVGPNYEFLRELLAILAETRSPDAFLVTLSILQEMKPEPREVVPVIIRNAERLRLFKRTDPDKGTEQQRMIVECLAELMMKDRSSAAVAGSPACTRSVSTPPELLSLPQTAEESETEEDPRPPAALKGPLALSEQDVMRVICRFLELQCLGRGKPHAGEVCVGRVKSSAVVK